MRELLVIFLLPIAINLCGQASDSLKKGSYLYFGQPTIEDNSMLMEEAFNQEAGVIQHISHLILRDGNLVYTYTQEIPLASDKHQLSFAFSYNAFKKQADVPESRFKSQGFGDMMISYKPLLLDKKDWALVIPRFTLIIPTGDARYGFGNGAWGGQFNLAVTKRLSKVISTHYNIGYTWLSGAHFYQTNNNQPQLVTKRDLCGFNWGSSLIWSVAPRLNFMLEYVSARQDEYSGEGMVERKNGSYAINPGFRFAFETGKVQIVPGIGLPLNFSSCKYRGAGALFYLSFEPAF